MEHVKAAAVVTKLALPERQAPLSTRSETSLEQKWIGVQLAGLAILRQVKLEDATLLDLYSKQLAGYPKPHIEAVLTAMARRPRQEYETAFPPLGEIIEELEAMAEKARNEQVIPYEPSASCRHLPGGGWRRTKDSDGDTCVVRCDCWKQWKGTAEVDDRKTVAAGE